MIGREEGDTLVMPAPMALAAVRGLRKLPSDFAGFRDLVARRKSCLPRQLRLAADYLVAHPDEIAFEPLVTIGKRAGVSPSCIVRLSQRLGFDGFSQLQRLFQRRLTPAEPPRPIRRCVTNDPLHDTLRATERVLKTLDRDMSRDLFVRAVETLAAARTIFVAGQGVSAGVAHLAAVTLRSAGFDAVVLDGTQAAPDGPASASAAADALLIFDLNAGREAGPAAVEGRRRRAASTVLVASRLTKTRGSPDTIGFEVGEAGMPDSAAVAGATCLVLAWAAMMRDRRLVA